MNTQSVADKLKKKREEERKNRTRTRTAGLGASQAQGSGLPAAPKTWGMNLMEPGTKRKVSNPARSRNSLSRKKR